MRGRAATVAIGGVLALGCGDDSAAPGAGSSTGGDTTLATSTGPSSTGSVDDTTTGGPPSVECTAEVESFVDPLRVVGSDEPGIDGLVSLTSMGSVVFGCSHDAGLVVWDLSSPSAPSLVARDHAPPAAADLRCDSVTVSIDGGHVVTTRSPDPGAQKADEDGAVTLWSVDDPAQPVVVASWATAAPVASAVADEARVFVAAGPDGVIALAIDGGTLVEQGATNDDDSDARALRLSADTLWVAQARSGVRAYDVAPDVPQPLGSVSLGAVSLDVELAELAGAPDQLVVATLEAVAVIDAADPTAPELVSQVPTAGAAIDVALHGDTVLAADWDELRGFSLTEPAVPRHWLAEHAPGSDPLDRARAVTMVGEHLVVSGWRGIFVYEVEAEPLAPELEVESRRADFRDVAPGDSDDHVVVLRNTGTAPLTICGIESTLPGVEIDAPLDTIDPASTVPVELTFTATTPDPQSGVLWIHTNDPDEPLWEVPLSANAPRVDVGDSTIAFHHLDTEGRAHRSTALDGQVRLFSYFASWCPTCNTEFPDYESQLHQVYADQGFTIVGLGNEPVGKILAFQTTVGATFPLLVAEHSYREWEDPPGGTYSMQVLVDRQGVVHTIGNGMTADELIPAIEALLAR